MFQYKGDIPKFSCQKSKQLLLDEFSSHWERLKSDFFVYEIALVPAILGYELLILLGVSRYA